MEIIKTYLDNLFAGLPDDERLLRAKSELLSTMEDKYNSLKEDGKSENEAIGTVISEFGNIDELLEELGISRTQQSAAPAAQAPADNTIKLTDEQADTYLRIRRSCGRMIGLGVLMCLLAPASLISLSGIIGPILGQEFGDMLALFSLFLFIAVGITLFIVSGMRLSKYEVYENQPIELPEHTAARISGEYERGKVGLGLRIGGGIALILFGVCVVIAGNTLFTGSGIADTLSVSVMLSLIGLGVMLMCICGVNNESFKNLLNIEKEERKKESHAESLFSSILWPCVVIAYFIWSFCFHGWAISWILFPIAGLVNGAASSIIRASCKKEQ